MSWAPNAQHYDSPIQFDLPGAMRHEVRRFGLGLKGVTVKLPAEENAWMDI